MSPTLHTLRYEARVDKSPLQMSTTTLDTIHIQQATVSPIPPTAHAVTSNTAAPLEPISTGPAEAAKPGASVNTKLGFAMIPVAVFAGAMAVLIALWLRRRQMRKAFRNRTPPAVPEKANHTPSTSFYFNNSGRRGTPTHDMNARSTPVHIMEACRTPMHTSHLSQSPVTNPVQSPFTNQVRPPVINQVQSHDRWTSTDQALLRVPIDMAVARHGGSVIAEPQESPIDGSSPFRLKRGNTINRNTLGSAIANTWPMPPPRARMNLSDPTGRIPFPRLDAEVYDQRPLTHVEIPRREVPMREVPRRIQWDEGRFQLGPDPGPTLRSDLDGRI
jgi:hypothetical protein